MHLFLCAQLEFVRENVQVAAFGAEEAFVAWVVGADPGGSGGAVAGERGWW